MYLWVFHGVFSNGISDILKYYKLIGTTNTRLLQAQEGLIIIDV